MLYGIVSNRGRMEILTGQCQNILITIPPDFNIHEDVEDYLGRICLKNGEAFDSNTFRWRQPKWFDNY